MFSLEKNDLLAALAPRLRRTWAFFERECIGLAKDFWKDGQFPARVTAPVKKKTPFVSPFKKKKKAEPQETPPRWHAEPGEISEKMWGDEAVTPADDYFTDLLVKPLSLTKDMSVLDLAAGLGYRLRQTTAQFGVYITGREPDAAVAARGMELSVKAGLGKKASITAYSADSFTETHKYDCIIARETFYRVADKRKFVRAIVDCCKPQAQISFTDYIVNPEDQNKPAILAWRAFEKDAAPLSLVEMAELWAQMGISLRVHDDQTEHYKREVKKGIIRLAKFLASSTKPDEETRKAINKRITTWAHRMAAMEEGLRFYRFYGLR